MPYTDLLVYRLGVTISDFTATFCDQFLPGYEYRRLREQMNHAARSGKQNLVEGNSARSMEENLKLSDVSRASYKELLEDYKDYLRQRHLPVWEKNDNRSLKVRSYKEVVGNETTLADLAHWTDMNFTNPENFGNMMICLIYKETYLLDKLILATQQKFVLEGGFRENLYKKRKEYKLNQLVQ